MSDYQWGFLVGAIVGAIVVWLNMRTRVNENPKPARSAAVCIDRLRLENSRLSEAIREAIAALNCSPLTPWDRCESQSVRNESHYRCHILEVIDLLGAELANHNQTKAVDK